MRIPESSLLRDSYWFPYKEAAMDRFTAPSFFLPDESPDSLWHLFCHSALGVVHHKSTSGLAWGKGDLVQPAGRFPSLAKDGNTYHMVFIREGRNGSSVFLSSSMNLVSWSRPIELLSAASTPLSAWRGSRPSLYCPQLVIMKGRCRLYAGAGTARFSGVRLPVRFIAAESPYIDGPYEVEKEPLFSPQPGSDPPVLASGPVRILPCQDGLAALEAAVCYSEKEDRAYSSLFLRFSKDGLGWEKGGTVLESRRAGWASGLITGAEARWKENERTWYCYYSVRSRVPGLDSMGLMLGQRARVVP